MFKLKSILAVGLLVAAGTANAATTNFGPIFTNSTGASVSVDVAVDTASTTLTGFNLTLQGDLSYFEEYVDITIDGVSIGRILDDDSSNDPFNFANDNGLYDFGDPPLSGSAALNIDISSLVSDGLLSIQFQTTSWTDFSSAGSGVFSGNNFFAAFQGSLTTDSVSPVPLPAAGFLLIAGLGGLGALRRKKKS